jgi:adenylosuccinate synthase
MTEFSSIIVDMGFGDAGKGLCTDAAARRLRLREPSCPVRVIRFNGGAQAGHNVVLADGRHHTFSQFGSASFLAGAETVLLDSVVVHPTALIHEAQLLESKGVRAPLTRIQIEPRALVTTPQLWGWCGGNHA